MTITRRAPHEPHASAVLPYSPSGSPQRGAAAAVRPRGGHAEGAGIAKASNQTKVHLSAEALERAGHPSCRRRRRALTGRRHPRRSAVRAEQHGARRRWCRDASPESPSRSATSVRRGQLLGVVASSDVSAARARLDQSRARLAAAESTLRRQQQLSTEGHRRAAVAHRRGGAGRRTARRGRRPKATPALGVRLGSAGQLALTSPIDGVVVAGSRNARGDRDARPTGVFIVTDPTKVWVRGNVPELESWRRVQVGSAAVVRLHAFPDVTMPGTITYVAPALDERTRSLPDRA